MSTESKLRELADLEGFSGAAVFTPAGELLAACGGDAQVRAAGLLAGSVLESAKRAALGAGAGRGQQVHLAGDRAHVLARCLNEGADPLRSEPGKAHLHLVVVLTTDASLGLAKERMAASIQALADELRG